jgi:hypothetical protein
VHVIDSEEDISTIYETGTLLYSLLDIIVIDPKLVEEWCKDTPALIYAKYTLGFSFNYTAAVNKYIPGWNEDVFKWKFKWEENIAEDIDG